MFWNNLNILVNDWKLSILWTVLLGKMEEKIKEVQHWSLNKINIVARFAPALAKKPHNYHWSLIFISKNLFFWDLTLGLPALFGGEDNFNNWQVWGLDEIDSVFNSYSKHVDASDLTAKCSVYCLFTIWQRVVQFRLLFCPFSEHSTSLVRQIPQYTFHIEKEFLWKNNIVPAHLHLQSQTVIPTILLTMTDLQSIIGFVLTFDSCQSKLTPKTQTSTLK